jgi:hypothetical protein
MRLFLGTGLDAGLHRPMRAPARAPGVPTLVRAPALIGPGLIGADLTVDPGVWADASRLSFVWLRGGAPIPGAAGETYAPAAEDDRATLACRVIASNDVGKTLRETPAITITYPAPYTVGAPSNFHYTQFTGPHNVDASSFFSGNSLSFSVTGDGVRIDSSTGLVTIDATSLVSGVAVMVTVLNSGGQAEASFRFSISAAQTAATPLIMVSAPRLSGSGHVGAELTIDPGVWSGAPILELQWLINGAPVAGATAPRFTPGRELNGAVVAARVTARTAAGEAMAETAAITIVHAVPAVTGTLDDLVLAQGAMRTVAAAAVFTGDGLRFSAEGEGASIDPATGELILSAAALRDAHAVTVTAENSGGLAQASFALTVIAAPSAIAPDPVILAQGAGSRTIATQAFFMGSNLVFSLTEAPEGVTIDPGAGDLTIPTGAALDATIIVRAANAVGAAVQSFAVTVLAAPVAAGSPERVILKQGAGARTVSAQAFFAGTDLVYTLDAAPGGVMINAGSGLVKISTASAFSDEIVLRAANRLGAVTQRLPVTVEATATQFDQAARLDELSFLTEAAAPAWSFDPSGFARLVIGRGVRAHGDWAHARGDGRYRTLARWNAGDAAVIAARPFSFTGRLARTGADFSGLCVDVVQSGNVRLLELRQYAGGGTVSTLIAAAGVAWRWDAWFWIEAEFNGPTVRARLYPEAAAAPDWQIVAPVTHQASGAFGPGALHDADSPEGSLDIRRLEFQTPGHFAAAPTLAAPRDGDWSLDQIMVRK